MVLRSEDRPLSMQELRRPLQCWLMGEGVVGYTALPRYPYLSPKYEYHGPCLFSSAVQDVRFPWSLMKLRDTMINAQATDNLDLAPSTFVPMSSDG